MKQIPAKNIESCVDCPHCSNLEYATTYVVFHCRHLPKEQLLPYNKGDISILEDCPLNDARAKGVLVGVAIILLNDKNEFLVGRRDNASSGNDAWGLPGGGMDAGEKPKITGQREIEEETSIRVIDPEKMEFATFTNDCFMEESGEHWITLYYLCRPDNWEGEAKRVEPHKCKEWRWVDVDNVPQPAFCDWAKNLEYLKAMIIKPKYSKRFDLLLSSEDMLKAYY